MVIVYAFVKFRAYLLGTKIKVLTDHPALTYLMAKKDAKQRLITCLSLFQKFDSEVKDRRGCENQVVDHISILEATIKENNEPKIDYVFPAE